MKHTNHGTHFRNLIGDSHNPEERVRGITSDELRQISNSHQRVSIGNENRYNVDKYGVVTGIKDNAIVYAC